MEPNIFELASWSLKVFRFLCTPAFCFLHFLFKKIDSELSCICDTHLRNIAKTVFVSYVLSTVPATVCFELHWKFVFTSDALSGFVLLPPFNVYGLTNSQKNILGAFAASLSSILNWKCYCSGSSIVAYWHFENNLLYTSVGRLIRSVQVVN